MRPRLPGGLSYLLTGLWKGESDDGGLSDVLDVRCHRLELVDLFLELGQALVQGEEIGLYSRWYVLPIGLRQRLRRYPAAPFGTS